MQIKVNHLCKHYSVHHKEPGLLGSLQSFVKRKHTLVKAVDDISFALEEGEIVGFLGPNGAGKTTTLKSLSGLLHPTSGEISVLGHMPWRRSPAFLKQITLIMGQKQQLLWDLPAIETFAINQAIYEIPDDQYHKTLAEMTDLLELGPLLKKQVRKLSLGERMKCELAAALLHQPKVLFLDEPTIGLDVTMQDTLRRFIGEYNREHQATILLTSHYMADITALCQRVIIIHQGRLIYDGGLNRLAEHIAPYKRISIKLQQPIAEALLERYGQVEAYSGEHATLLVAKADVPAVAASLLSDVGLADLSIADPPLEQVIAGIFGQERDSDSSRLSSVEVGRC